LRLGLMGGTFDPIHIGHLILADQAMERLALEKVLFVTAANPPHKCCEQVSDAAHRLEMTRLAIEGNAAFELSTVEMERDGPSYTIDTIKHLLGIYGAGTEIFLLLGADEGRDLMGWHQPLQISELANIVIANRPGMAVSEVIETLPVELGRRVVPLDMPGVDISSTDLRERVRSGRSIRYLVPGPVEDYIWAKGLYK
jgi:nicotinate-nucleotide adenylyltransferase